MLESEKMVLASPFGFKGSLQRIAPLAVRGREWWQRVLWFSLAVTLVAFAWVLILCLYLTVGLLVIPFRLIGRSNRKRKIADARHRELLAATERKTAPLPEGNEAVRLSS